MIDKKAKRYVLAFEILCMADLGSDSALSLRLFGEDITTAAREGGKKGRADAAASAANSRGPEPGPVHDDEDGSMEEGEISGMDGEQQE